MIEIPGYTIKGEISVGKDASILLAEQTSLGRDVALKVMAPERVADKAHGERFLQVARTLASFSHPNIVAVYDVGVSPLQTPYYSMQYLSGGDFAARAERGMSEPDLTETLASITRAVGYIHQRGLIHRAISPQNVLYDAYNTAVLIDFGATPTPTQESFVTNTGFAVEVGRFMSPEQARGGDQDARSDIYSLGALTFFGLTGRAPYDGADGFAIAYAHVFEPIPRLPPARAHWQPVIDCALAKEPKDRYSSVEEFLDALTNVGLDRDATLSAPVPSEPAATVFAVPAAPESPAEPVAERDAPATIIPTKSVKPEAAPRPAVGSPSSLARFWPLAVAGLGLILIAAALLVPKRSAVVSPLPVSVVEPMPATPAPSVVTTSPDESQPGTDATARAPTTEAPAAADTDASVAASDAAPDAAPVEPAGMLDAAEAQAEADAMDPGKAPTVVDPLPEAVRLGRVDLAAQRLIAPPGRNALERFQFALSLEPRSKQARLGIVDVAKKFVELADQAASEKTSAGTVSPLMVEQLGHAADVSRLIPEGAAIMKDVAARRRKAVEPLIALAKAAAERWDKAAAKSAYEEALKVDADNAAARDGLKFVATIGEPGFVFRDRTGESGSAPAMIVLPGGGLAMARHPVTRGEFRRFWESAGRAEFGARQPSCRDRESIFRSSKKRSWEDPDIVQDDSHPVVCVSWPEAAAYAQWLGKLTGKRYRLPSPAEFDRVAARAGRGDCASANLADAAYSKQFDSRDGSQCNDGFAATSPVERFGAIEGVFDIDGNVREWVAACGNGAVAAAGSSCRDFLVKGRSWLSLASKESATFKDDYADDVSLNSVGFRVVRDLSN